MDPNGKLSAFAGKEWVEVLIEECEEEVKEEARWPTILLKSNSRRTIWCISSILGVNDKGVPGCACRLLERYLSCYVRTFLQESRDTEEWERFKHLLVSRLYLLMVSCIQLAAKMSDLLAPISASIVKEALLRKGGINYSTAQIVESEFHVFGVLDHRVPLWTTLEIAEFLAVQVGMTEGPVLKTLGLIMNLVEYHRDFLELFMKGWVRHHDVPTTMSAANPNSASLHNVHVCASTVAATALYVRHPRHNLAVKLAAMLRVNSQYIITMTKTILCHIIPDSSHRPIRKKRRLV